MTGATSKPRAVVTGGAASTGVTPAAMRADTSVKTSFSPCCFAVGGAGWLAYAMPETKGKTLEQIEALFN